MINSLDLIGLCEKYFPDSKIESVSISKDGQFNINFVKNPIDKKLIEDKIPIYKKQKLLEEKKQKIKKECENRIFKKYPQHKQVKIYTDFFETSDNEERKRKYYDTQNFIKNLVDKSNELEQQLNDFTFNELEDFNEQEDSYWEVS